MATVGPSIIPTPLPSRPLSPASGGPAEDGYLLATKVVPPAVTGQPVPRPRLTALLDGGLAAGRRLTVVTAPAGWGKTTLIADWAARTDGPVAWVALDARGKAALAALRASPGRAAIAP